MHSVTHMLLAFMWLLALRGWGWELYGFFFHKCMWDLMVKGQRGKATAPILSDFIINIDKSKLTTLNTEQPICLSVGVQNVISPCLVWTAWIVLKISCFKEGAKNNSLRLTLAGWPDFEIQAFFQQRVSQSPRLSMVQILYSLINLQ